MPLFQITISPARRVAARFISGTRRALQQALVEENKKRGLTQSDIAREIGVHRSVINRELRGQKDLTLGRVAELAHALGRKPSFSLVEEAARPGANTAQFPTLGCAASIQPSTLAPKNSVALPLTTNALFAAVSAV